MEFNSESAPDTSPEEPKRPSLLRQTLPWVITALIFYWLISRVDFTEVWHQMQMADLWLLIPVMAVQVGVMAAVEIFPFRTSYKWFSDRLPSYWQVAVARVSTYPTQVLFTPLAEVQVLTYLVKVYKMSLSRAFTSDIFTFYPDQMFGGIWMLIAVILVHLTGAEPIHWFFYALLAANLVFVPLWFGYWMTGWKDRMFLRIRDLAIFHSWKTAGWGQVLKMFLMRLPMPIANFGSMYACLWAFDIHVPISVFLAATPLIMFSVFAPVQVGGYGGPQAMAILFYGKYATEEVIVAQSLLWSSLFALFRILAGAVFVYPAIKGFQNRDRIQVPPAAEGD